MKRILHVLTAKERGMRKHNVRIYIHYYDQINSRIRGNKILSHHPEKIWDQILEMKLRSW